MPPPSEPILQVDLIDLLAVFHLTQKLSASQGPPDGNPVRTNFRALIAALAEVRDRLGWPAAQATLAYAARDPQSRAQQRFLAALREAGVTAVEELDFHACYVTQIGEPYYERECPSSVGPSLTYALGLLAARSEASPAKTGAHVLVVSGTFDFAAAAKDFVSPRRKGRLAIVWPQTYLDSRWISSRLLEEKESGILFEDLERRGGTERIWGVRIKRDESKSDGLATL